MSKRVILDEATRQKALALHAGGMSKLQIAKYLNMKETSLREVYDKSYRDRSQRRDTARRIRKRTNNYVLISAQPPEEVINERNNAYSAQVGIGALLFGDPRPGRSALDRRNGG